MNKPMRRGHPISFLPVLLLLCFVLLQITAGAQETGSLQINYTEDGNAVTGAVFRAYRIAEIEQTTAAGEDLMLAEPTSAKAGLEFHSLIPELDLSGLESGSSMTSLRSAQQMAAACDKAVVANLGSAGRSSLFPAGSIYKGTTDERGQIVMNEMQAGLYLVREEQPVDGYRASVPFLVSIPAMGSSSREYDVKAEPKPEKRGGPTTGSITGEGSSTGENNYRSTGVYGSGGQTGSVKTGDASEPERYLCLLFLSIFSISVMIGMGRKRQRRNFQ